MTANNSPAARPPLWITCLVLLALAGGLASTGLLSFERLFQAGLPGCGTGSGCAAASRSSFAHFYRLPVAHLGLANVVALSLGWLSGGRTATRPLVWWARAGAVVSFGFLVLIAEHGYYCSYCLVAHACNLTLWALLERSPRPARWRLPAAGLVVGFGLVLLAIAGLKPLADDFLFRQSERRTEEIIDRLVRSARTGERPGEWLPIPAEGGIRCGPADAPIRITVFLDYQCGPCRYVARVLAPLVGRPGVAITWRHLPHCLPCNPYLKKDLHPHACRAARLAAATAGTPAFARAHEWLLQRGGKCAAEDIEEALPSLGITDAPAFWARLHAAETRQAVRSDVELAERLGLDSTPVVYVNGVRLEGLHLGWAVHAAVRALEAPPS
jgi:uncharacterized membrane protein